MSATESFAPAQIRVDVWLDVSCVCKTRAETQRACKGGKVSVNGERVKPHREILAGDRVTITTPSGRLRQLLVKALADRHLLKVEARTLYDDITPPPTPEEAELRDLLRRASPVAGARARGGRRNDASGGSGGVSRDADVVRAAPRVAA